MPLCYPEISPRQTRGACACEEQDCNVGEKFAIINEIGPEEVLNGNRVGSRKC
jgi:hypothetical protein